VATSTLNVTVQTCGANYDSTLQIFDGTGGCGGLVSLGCNDDSCGLQSQLALAQVQGTTYFIRVGGFNGGTGNFPLDILAAGEECSIAEVLVNGANGPYTTTGYTTSAPAWPCGGGGRDRWFTYTATCSGTVTIDTCGGGYDTTLEAFDACGGTSLVCNDDANTGPCQFTLQSLITFPVVQNTTYFIRVGGWAGSTGTTGINVNCTQVGVANDECVFALPLVLGANGPFSNAGSTTSAPGWLCGAGANDVWFSHVATCCVTTFDTCGGNYDSTLEVFDACGGNSLACNDDTCGLQSSVTVLAATGQTLFVRMGGFFGSTGSAPINVSCVAGVPANDDCTGAIPVSLGVNGPFTNNCSTTSFAWPCAAGGSDVWFSFVANCTCPTTFQTCGANYDTAIEVFDGTGGCANLVSLGCNDDNFSGGPCLFTLQSWLTVNCVMGTTYYVRVGGFVGQTGNFPLEIQTGTSLGTIAMTTASGCTVAGNPVLTVTGNPNIGGTVTAAISGNTGLGFVTFGFVATQPLMPQCPCNILSTATSWTFAPSISLTIPCFAGFIGLGIETQGADLFGAPAACGFPVPNAFTDIWTLTIG